MEQSKTIITKQNLLLKTAIESDLPALAKLFDDSVRQVAPQKYSPEQVDAWAASATDTEFFSRFILESTTFIAEENNLLGFGGIRITTAGQITSLYVRGNCNRKGVGSKLLEKILEYARINQCDRLYTEASEFSKPLFEKFGFEIYGEEEVMRNGVLFQRSLMQKFIL